MSLRACAECSSSQTGRNNQIGTKGPMVMYVPMCMMTTQRHVELTTQDATDIVQASKPSQAQQQVLECLNNVKVAASRNASACHLVVAAPAVRRLAHAGSWQKRP